MNGQNEFKFRIKPYVVTYHYDLDKVMKSILPATLSSTTRHLYNVSHHWQATLLDGEVSVDEKEFCEAFSSLPAYEADDCNIHCKLWQRSIHLYTMYMCARDIYKSRIVLTIY